MKCVYFGATSLTLYGVNFILRIHASVFKVGVRTW
jgi:hypothetical protein